MEKMILKISDYILKLDFENRLESIPKTIFVFFILVLNYLTFDLNGNEEQYLLYAKQFMDPDWITSRYLNEFPGTRLLYQILLGFFLKYFSFELVLFFSRLILCFCFAHVLFKIYKVLKFKNIHILLHLPVLFLVHQSFFAGSWMLVSVEPKGIAYVFVLYALYHYLKSNYKAMVVFLILGTYFHILVGGYAFMFFMLCLLCFERAKPKLEFIKLGFLYILIVSPFVFYLKTAVSKTIAYTPSVDWIYTYYRSPQHTALFKSMSYFYSEHFYGVLLSVVALFVSVFFFSVFKNNAFKRLNHFVFLSLLWVLLAVVIAYFDTQGVLLKYYPFRINTLSTFIFTLLLTSFLFTGFKSKLRPLLVLMVFMISLIFMLKVSVPTVKGMYQYLAPQKEARLDTMAHYIKAHTEKDAVILSFIEDVSLNRRLERDLFVVYKFIPAVMNDIPEWYERIQYKKALAQNISLLRDRKKDYKIDYFLSRSAVQSDVFELIYSHNHYYLYKVKP